MKQKIKKAYKYLFFLLYLVLRPPIFRFLNQRFNKMYSMWKCNEFFHVGSLYINFPIYLKGGKYITIGENFYSDYRLRLEAWDQHLGYKFSPKITFGNNVIINSDCHIGAINEITIGDNVLIASKVFITDHYHGEITSEAISNIPSMRKLYSKGSVKIGNNVWIGEGAVVLPNVVIGENCIIGANSVITKSIPKNSVVGGNPAKILRSL